MARIVVTGATGFVGGRVAASLRRRGDEVVAVVRTPDRALEAIGVHQVEGGLGAVDPGLLAGATAVVHAAASVGPDLEVARAVNRDGTRHVVDRAVAAGTPRFVHVSTVSVYDLDAVGDTEVDESAPLTDGEASPSGSAGSAYAITKAEAEAEVAAGVTRGLSAVVLRPPAVLGAGATSTWGTRVPRRILDGEPWPRHPLTTFAYVHVDDLVDAVLAGLDGVAEVTVNVVGGHTTVGAYLDAIARLLPGDVEPVADVNGTPWRGRFATERLPAALGVTPTRTFEQGMQEISASWASGTHGGG